MHNYAWKIGLYEQFEADGVCSGIRKVCQDAGAKKHEYKISNESVKSLIVHTKQHSEYKAKIAKLEDSAKEAP
uniref:Uncharacterized protein n=1 Tax=Ditylenchus dipsaci TaxID=166011 RepID=A0A915CSN2_9BILA